MLFGFTVGGLYGTHFFLVIYWTMQSSTKLLFFLVMLYYYILHHIGQYAQNHFPSSACIKQCNIEVEISWNYSGLFKRYDMLHFLLKKYRLAQKESLLSLNSDPLEVCGGVCISRDPTDAMLLCSGSLLGISKELLCPT